MISGTRRVARRLLVTAGVALLTSTVSPAAGAQAGSYLLDSTNPSNGHTLTLLAGEWSIGVTAGAWSPWSYLERCDVNGANCHTGFHTPFYYQVNGGESKRYGWDGGERETPTTSDFYATPELAFANAFAPMTLVLQESASVRLFIPDCCFWDNRGTMTVEVAQRTRVVSEPAAVGLVVAGLSGLIAVARARRKEGVIN